MVGDKVEVAGAQQRLVEPLAMGGNRAPRAHAVGAVAVAAEAGVVAAQAAASEGVASVGLAGVVSAAAEGDDRSHATGRIPRYKRQ